MTSRARMPTASGVAKPILVLPQEKVVWRLAANPGFEPPLTDMAAAWALGVVGPPLPSTAQGRSRPGRYSVDRLTGRSLPRPLLRRPAHGPFPAPAARPARNGGRRRVQPRRACPWSCGRSPRRRRRRRPPRPGTTKLPGRGRRPPPVPSQEEFWALVVSGGRAGPPPGPLRAPAAC